MKKIGTMIVRKPLTPLLIPPERAAPPVAWMVPVMETAMAKGTIVVMLRAERWRAFLRAENQAGLRLGISLVQKTNRGRSVQFGTNNAAKAAMNPTAPPMSARPPGD